MRSGGYSAELNVCVSLLYAMNLLRQLQVLGQEGEQAGLSRLAVFTRLFRWHLRRNRFGRMKDNPDEFKITFVVKMVRKWYFTVYDGAALKIVKALLRMG
jgi:hypothetical protein